MSNAIVEALRTVSEKLTKQLGEDGAQAVEKLYRVTGENGEKILAKTAETDAKHQKEILDILKRMDKNADKDVRSTAQRASAERERASLQNRLSKLLDPDSEETRNAAADLEKARHPTRLSDGHSAELNSKYGPKVNVEGLSHDEQIAAMRDQTRDLGDKTLADPALDERRPGCSCGLLSNDNITTHTSMRATEEGQRPNVHPALQQYLDDMRNRRRDLTTGLGRGHGKCGEIGVISDKLWEMDPNGTQITSLKDMQRSLRNNDGTPSSVFSTIIGDSDQGGLAHGDYLPPCNSCGRMLPDLGVVAAQ